MRITVIQDKDVLSKIEKTVTQIMPGLGEQPMYNAPTVILVSGKKGDETASALGYCNASCIIENVLLEATELGLGSVYLFAVPAVMRNVPDLCTAVSISDDFLPLVMAAVGKSNDEILSRSATTDKIHTDIL